MNFHNKTFNNDKKLRFYGVVEVYKPFGKEFLKTKNLKYMSSKKYVAV